MNARSTTDLAGEREIDLARWRTAVLRWWWIPLLGLIGGAIVGVLYSTAGGSVYQASVLIAPAQPFGPNGNAVLNYISTPRWISALVEEPTSLQLSADAGGGAAQGNGEGAAGEHARAAGPHAPGRGGGEGP